MLSCSSLKLCQPRPEVIAAAKAMMDAGEALSIPIIITDARATFWGLGGLGYFRAPQELPILARGFLVIVIAL